MYGRILMGIAVLTMCGTIVFAQVVDITTTAPAEKKPGVIRIGISSPIAEMGKDFSFTDTPLATRNTLEVALKDENVETVFLESSLPEKEAKLKKCDYIFSAKLPAKRGAADSAAWACLADWPEWRA